MRTRPIDKAVFEADPHKRMIMQYISGIAELSQVRAQKKPSAGAPSRAHWGQGERRRCCCLTPILAHPCPPPKTPQPFLYPCGPRERGWWRRVAWIRAFGCFAGRMFVRWCFGARPVTNSRVPAGVFFFPAEEDAPAAGGRRAAGGVRHRHHGRRGQAAAAAGGKDTPSKPQRNPW
jgi:hypothetical protein